MLHPVGGLAPSVYWRRRVLLLAALLLALLSVYAVFFRGGGSKPPKSAGAFFSSGSTPPASVTDTTAAASATSTATSTPRSSSTPPAKACSASQLKVAAASDSTAYRAGAKPKVALVVTNLGPGACVADLSDRQIELRIYNGSARIWGSHDCAIQPGTSPSTLPVGQQTRREIQWSGLSSRVGCAGVRQRVPAGNYTLFAYLAGHQGSTAAFSMAG